VQTDLSDVARSRLEQWEALAEETGVRIILYAPTEAHITALPGAAEQIIDNLIDNALAVAPQDSKIRLTVAPVANGDFVELHVLDEGPGLSEHDRHRAFHRFWRGSESSGGSGLGLAIVQQLSTAGGGGASLAPAPDGPGLDASVRFQAAAP
jgi:signal transduction histidine kinase